MVDVSALLWTLNWPTHGTIETFISGFKLWLSKSLSESDVYLCFDQYLDYSTKSSTRSFCANTTRVHQLDCKTQMLAQDAVLKNSANKKQLNSLICEQILNDNNYLQDVTHAHKLVVSIDQTATKEVSKGRKTSRLDLVSTQEEADIIITQQAIHLAKEDPHSHVRVICDATDVFATFILLHEGKAPDLHDNAITNQKPMLYRH